GMRIDAAGHHILATGVDHLGPRWRLELFTHGLDHAIGAIDIGTARPFGRHHGAATNQQRHVLTSPSMFRWDKPGWLPSLSNWSDSIAGAVSWPEGIGRWAGPYWPAKKAGPAEPAFTADLLESGSLLGRPLELSSQNLDRGLRHLRTLPAIVHRRRGNLYQVYLGVIRN